MRLTRLLAAGVAGALAGCSDAAPPPAPTTADQVRAFFEEDPAGRAALGLGPPSDRPFCGVDVLGGSADGRFTYAWVLCGIFERTDDGYRERSAVSVPVRLDATTRTARLPQDGSGYADSIRAMFPPDLAERAIDQDVTVDRTGEQLRVAAARAGG